LSSGEDISVSGLWTPSGEHEPEPRRGEPEARPPGEPSDGADEPDEAAAAEEWRRVRAAILETPAAELVANHAIGLWELAQIHLNPGTGPARLDEAGLAIDAMAGIVEQLGDRLGSFAPPLREALAQLRLAYVEVQARGGGA
jgi:hypothetical protein